MRITFRNAAWVVLLGLVFLPAALAQQGQRQGQGQGQPQQQQPPRQPGTPGQAAPAQPTPAQPAAPPVNPEEEAAYKAFFDLKETEVDLKIQRGEEFLKKFPESRYRDSVYSTLLSAYVWVQQPDKVLATGEKALQLNPDNLTVLATMGRVLPRLTRSADLDAEQKLEKAEKYSKHAIELLGNIQKPDNLTEEDFTKAKNEMLAMCHSGLGFTYIHRQRYPDSVTALEQATTLIPDADPSDFFLLGVAYQETKRFSDAVKAFGRCSEETWALQERCKQSMEQAKKLAAAQPAAPKP